MSHPGGQGAFIHLWQTLTLVSVIVVWSTSLRAQQATAVLEYVTPPMPIVWSQIVDETGQPVPATRLHERVTIVHFWATWCAPCVHELPSLIELSRRFSDKPIQVIAISLDEKGQYAVKKFIERFHIDGLVPYYSPDKALSRDLGVSALPMSFIANKQGHIVARVQGALDWASAEVIEFIQHVIGP